jgi:hypothetical protein
MRFPQLLVPVLGCGFLLCPAEAQKPQKPQKPLSIVNVALSQFEDGPTVPASQGFAPGEAIFFSFQVTGYQPEGEEDLSIRLQWNMEVRDSIGVPVIPPHGAKIATGIAREDKEWMPKMRHTIELPPFAEPGKYKIAISVDDEVAKASASKEVEFTVRGRAFEPASALSVRNLNFYRTENDRDPAPVAAYRPGDTVWIKFDIAGYKFSANNKFQVGYGITVLRPNGEATLNQPEAAVETDETFYPRRVLPAMLSLNLPKDVQAGQFTVIITATDKFGDQQHEARGTFTVEP